MVLSVGVHYTFAKRSDVIDGLNAITGMTHMTSLSLGVSYYEPRVQRVNDQHNIIYPQMMAIGRMDFVYAQ